MVLRMKKVLKEQRGLTLIELLAVVVILGIIAAIAVPAIGNIIEGQKEKAHKANAIMLLDAAKLYFLDNPNKATDTEPVDLATLAGTAQGATKKYLDVIPLNPETNEVYKSGSVAYNSGNYKVTLEGAKLGGKDISGWTRQEVLNEKQQGTP
ncbi:type II secretion system protein [Aneurinibacillus aneurinilyticus]|jgi:type IV pilus assembly protein PilA|uniref:type II secretion system protein n=1 Tax=Aneurinibacillus aneurinilyticus TaxID=1391 RepID=UPI0023F3C49F|nr:type II secretion system protein [Aneurinibacillus aneurinilyticus]MCI1693864.1 type II secretion system GspH family protein [Aneurinibacillus aneurinilyticus]